MNCEIFECVVPAFMVYYITYGEDDTMTSEEKDLADSFVKSFESSNVTFDFGEEEYFSSYNDVKYDKACSVVDCKVAVF